VFSIARRIKTLKETISTSSFLSFMVHFSMTCQFQKRLDWMVFKSNLSSLHIYHNQDCIITKKWQYNDFANINPLQMHYSRRNVKQIKEGCFGKSRLAFLELLDVQTTVQMDFSFNIKTYKVCCLLDVFLVCCPSTKNFVLKQATKREDKVVNHSLIFQVLLYMT